VEILCEDNLDRNEEHKIPENVYLDTRFDVNKDETDVNEVCMTECTEYNHNVETLNIFQGLIFMLRTA